MSIKDGDKVTLDKVLKAEWIIESHNEFTHSTTYVSNDKEQKLGVTFYDGYEYGTVYRND